MGFMHNQREQFTVQLVVFVNAKEKSDQYI